MSLTQPSRISVASQLNSRKSEILLQKQIGYVFQDPRLLKRALTHKSFSSSNNERLEFLGDSILNYCITEALFLAFPESPEGRLSRLRAQLVKGETLAGIALDLELGKSLYLGEGELKSGGSKRSSILADAVEALLGAIVLESGELEAKKVVLKLFDSRLSELNLQTTTKDYKTLLQEWLQARQKPLPSYSVKEIQGEAHNQTFVVECGVEGLKKATSATASNRKSAEKKAAQLMLELLENPEYAQ